MMESARPKQCLYDTPLFPEQHNERDETVLADIE